MDFHTNMTRKQAELLKMDLEKSITPADYIEDLYVSINGVGSKIYRKCVYLEAEGWLFIWTADASYMFSKKELKDTIVVPASYSTSFNFSTI
jgi:hypothetical protein